MFSVDDSTALDYGDPQFSNSPIWICYILNYYVGTFEAQRRGTMHLHNMVLPFQLTPIMDRLLPSTQDMWIRRLVQHNEDIADIHRIIRPSDIVYYITRYSSRY